MNRIMKFLGIKKPNMKNFSEQKNTPTIIAQDKEECENVCKELNLCCYNLDELLELPGYIQMLKRRGMFPIALEPWEYDPED